MDNEQKQISIKYLRILRYADNQPYQAVMTFLMDYRDWCELKETGQWECLIDQIEEDEK